MTQFTFLEEPCIEIAGVKEQLYKHLCPEDTKYPVVSVSKNQAL